MKPFHSSLLKPMPLAAKPKRSRIPRRMLLISILSAFVLVPVIIILTRVLPKDGIGYVFYWAHDHIFLPIKGYTYTMFYPFSLSWWGPVLTVLVMWLVAYLLMISFIKDPHVSILRKVIKRKPNKRHRILIKTSHWLKKWKMEPLLLKEVVQMERRICLHHLGSNPLTQPAQEAIQQLYGITALQVSLLTLPPVENAQETYLKSLQYWLEADLQVQARLGSGISEDLSVRLNTQFGISINDISLTLLESSDENQLPEKISQPAGIDMDSIVVEILSLAALYNHTIHLPLPGITTASSPETVKQAVLNRLAESLHKRRTILEELYIRLEKLRKQRIGILDPSDSDVFDPLIAGLVLPESEKSFREIDSFYSSLGELSLLLAMHLSIITGDVSIGLGYMETLETLDFAFNCLNLPETTDSACKAFITLQALCRLPGPNYYRLCAEMTQRDLERYETLWKESVLKEDKLIRPGDIQLARNRIESLNHAAGPPPEQSK